MNSTTIDRAKKEIQRDQSKKVRLPSTETISDWFTKKQPKRLKRILGRESGGYHVYSVYSDKGML